VAKRAGQVPEQRGMMEKYLAHPPDRGEQDVIF
jgi:hypothetical protein